MNILIIQSSGKHPKNANYRECLCLKRGLDTLQNIKSTVWGMGYQNYSTSLESIAKDYDAIVVIENYHSEWIKGLTEIKKLKLFWSIDSHIALKRHQQFVKNNKINITLNSTSTYVKYFPKKCYWFPNAYDDILVNKMDIPKKYDIGFCGNFVNRKPWIDKLKSTFKMKTDIMVIGDDMVRVINSYKIHWNKNYSNDINYRTFETLGCGTVLLTNKTDRISDLFDINKHLVVYRDFADCCNKIKYLLNDENGRNTIAEAGYNHVKLNHTYRNRAAELVKIIEKNV